MNTKFSIARLEEVRANPIVFANKLKNPRMSNDIFRLGKFAYWKYAAYNYHKTNDLDGAKRYLSNKLSNFKTLKGNKSKIDEYTNDLETYVNSHHDYSYHYLNSRVRIRIDLSPQLYISGEVPIVNMITHSGFAIFFFEESYKNWEQELRFPLIQHHFANNVLGCDLSQIYVGIYCVETSQHHSKRYSIEEISTALDEVSDINNIMTAMLR